jgi:hypothetical protein
MVLLVILLSYGFYVFAYSGSTLEQYAASAGTAIREAGRKATSQIIGGTTRALSATSEALFSEAAEEPVAAASPLGVSANRTTNRNRSANFLA